jgi:hypothetical protein
VRPSTLRLVPAPGARRETAGAINIFSVTSNGFQWWRQRYAFFVGRRKQWLTRSFTGREPANVTLRQINVLHSAAWLRAGRFPRFRGVQRERRHLLFCSNFAGPWDPYRQSFLDVMPGGIKSFWGPSEDFPRFPKRGTRYHLEQWMYQRLPPTQHYYRAYPDLTPADVRSAVRLAQELQAYRLRMPSPEHLRTSFEQLQTLVSDSTGTLRSPPPPLPPFGPSDATGMSGFVSLVPIRPGREPAVRAYIDELRIDPSPFASVPGTHFARLAVLGTDADPPTGRRRDGMRGSWLLFGADFDGCFPEREGRARRINEGELRRYLDAVASVDKLGPIWSECVDVADAGTIVDVLARGVLSRFLFFRDHPDLTLRDVFTGLAVRAEYERWLAANAGRRPDGAAINRLLAAVGEASHVVAQ